MQTSYPFRRGRGGFRQTRFSGNSARSVPYPTSSPTLGKALRLISSVKSTEVEKEGCAYSHIVINPTPFDGDVVEKLRILLGAVRAWPDSGAVQDNIIDNKINLSVIDSCIQQAQKDPSFSLDVLKDYTNLLETHMTRRRTRYEYAKLFTNLLDEWLASKDVPAAFSTAITKADESLAGGPYIDVGSPITDEQNVRLASAISEKNINGAKLIEYLERIIATEDDAAALLLLRASISSFATQFTSTIVKAVDIQSAIISLLTSTSMDDARLDILRAFLDNWDSMIEIAHVVCMRLANLPRWSWPAEGVSTALRIEASGKIDVFMYPEVVDAIFFEYIGMEWRRLFQSEFGSLFKSTVWKYQSEPRFAVESRTQMEMMVGINIGDSCIEASRLSGLEYFFATRLELAERIIREGDLTYCSVVDPETSPRHVLLHAAITECHLNNALHGQHAIVHTALDSFETSIPHGSILVVLAFFGVPQIWLDFFQAFLRAPLRLLDDPDGEIKVRRRGVHSGFTLSALFGETVLFGLDLADNHRAKELYFCHIYDDIWMWDPSPARCAAAWDEMIHYASLVGLSFDQSKTGSASTRAPDNSEASKLPVGDVRWDRFLLFEPASSCFVIDHAQVECCITALRQQLSSTTSILGFVAKWNDAMASFVRELAAFHPSACVGQSHIDAVIDTVAHVERALFPATGNSSGVAGHVMNHLSDRFGVRDIPAAYLHLPVHLGGLGLRDPFVELFNLKGLMSDPAGHFVEQMEVDIVDFRNLRANWEKRSVANSVDNQTGTQADFITYEEYIAHRKTLLPSWSNTYLECLRVCRPSISYTSPQVFTARNSRKSTQRVAADIYEMMVLEIYQDSLMKRFGALEVVDSTMIPLGALELLKSSKTR